jgi:AI-2 transport protein TqsA
MLDRLRDEQTWWVIGALGVLATVALGAALAYMKVLMVPFVLAIFLSYLIAPLVDALEARRAPRWVAVTLGFLVVVLLTTVVGLLVTSAVRQLVDQADNYEESLRNLVRDVLDFLGVEAGRRSVMEALRQLPLFDLLSAAAGTVFSLLSTLTLVVIFTLFLLAGRNAETARRGIYGEIDRAVRRYVVTKFVVSASTGILVGLLLAALGLKLAMVFGVLAFLLNFIPNVGSVISTLLPLPLAFAQFDNWWLIGAVVVLPGALQMVIGNGIEPVFMGEGLDLHPVTILLALGVWGILWGVPGMFLAAPITAVLRIVLAPFETTRPLSEMLAGRPPRLGDGPARSTS